MATQTDSKYDRPFPERFATVLSRVRRLHVAWGCVLACAVLAAGILLADGVDRLHSLRERVVLALVLAAAGLALFVLVRQLFQALFRGPAVHDLALAVERARPDFMDALVCAVEIEAKPAVERNDLERALIADVQRRLQEQDDLDSVFESRAAWRRLAVIAVIMAACAALALNSRAWDKATARLADWRHGTQTGLTVSGPDAPVPVHSDVMVTAQIRRWERLAHIEYVDAEGRHAHRMNRGGDDDFFFSFYDITAPIRYRVVTPSLAGRWHTVETYVPPSFEAVQLTATPPEYTGLSPLVQDEFGDVATVEGSRLEVAVRSQSDVSAVLHTPDGTVPLTADGSGSLGTAVVVEEDADLHVTLVSAEGWTLDGPVFRLTARPDLPPVVDLVEPRGDVQAGAQETVSLEARAGDDFGLRRVVLTYAISGGPAQSLALFTAETERVTDQAVYHDIVLSDLKVEAGDVVRYFLSAADNREPEAQEARSEVLFIVVRPELEQQEQEGNQGEQKKLDVSALIAESKRLIRLTFDTLSLPEKDRLQPLEQLSRDLRDLRLEVRKTFNQAMDMAGGNPGGPIPELFGGTDRELGSALAMVEQGRLDDAVPPQEKALGYLVRLENELLKNAAKSQGQQNEQSQEQSESKPNEEQQETSAQDVVKALQQALQRARDMAQRQATLNRDMSSARNASEEVAQGLGAKQDALRQDAGQLSEELERMDPARRAARTLQGAEREMDRGSQRLEQTDVPTAETHGKRASNLLGAAVQDLQEAIRQAAANRIDALARAAQNLSDAQRREARRSAELATQDSPDEESLQQGEEAQRQLNRGLEALQRGVSQTAAQLEEQYPDATQALTEASRSLGKQDVERNMTRAANALLYGRPGRAQRPQTDAANALQQFSGQLEDAARQLPAMSREELVEAMRQMQRQAQATAQAMGSEGDTAMQQLESIQQQASRDLDRLAAALSDEALQQIADRMALPLGEDTPSRSGREMLGMFKAAVGVLEQHLLATEVKRRLDLSRRQSDPPEKYRRLVEQYFRELSREP